MDLANAVARRSELRVNGQAYPGFVSYVGNDTSFGTDGLLLHSATIVIADHHTNPTGLDDRAEGSIWVFGQKLELWVELSTGALTLHPRGTLYLLNAHYSRGILNINCGCLLSLLKVLGVDDVKADETEEWPTGFSDVKLYNNSAISTLIQEKLGYNLPAIPGQSWGPISISGSLIDYLGSLAFTNSNPGVLWASASNILFAPVNLKQPANWLTVNLGKNEVSYEAIDSGLTAIRELIVTAQVKEPKVLESGEVVEEDGTTETTDTEQEFGPESLLDPDAGDDEILLATVINIERISPSLRYAETKRTERTGLVFPASKTNRYTMVDSFRERFYQHFDPVTGRLMYELTYLEEPFGKVYSGWLTKRSNWIVSNPGNLGFNGAGVSLGTTYADELLVSTALVRSKTVKTSYVYGPNGEVISKITVTKEPASKIAVGSPDLDANDEVSSFLSETWKQRGKNQTKRIVEKRAFEAANASQVEALQKSRYEALVASGNDSTIQVSTFTRATNGTITLGTTNVPQDTVGIKTRLSLITNTKTSKKRLSRSGLETAPATEYLPNIKPKNQSEKSDSLEDVDIRVKLKWGANLLAKAPREVANIGLIDSKQTLDKVADYLFKLRQGQAKSYELVLPLTDKWLTDYAPGKRIDVIVNGQVVSYVANGLTYKSEPDKNLVLLDALWVGGMPGSPVSLVEGGGLQSPNISPGSPVYVPPGFSIPSGNYQTIPFNTGFKLVDSQGVEIELGSIPPDAQIVNLSPNSLKPAFEASSNISGGVRIGGWSSWIDYTAIKSSHSGGLNIGGYENGTLNPYFDLMPTCRNDQEGLPGGRVLTASNVELGGVVDVVLNEYLTIHTGDIQIYHINDLYAWPDPSSYTLVNTIPNIGAEDVNLGAVNGEWVAFFAYNPDKLAYAALRATYDRVSNVVTLWGWFNPLYGGG